MLHTLQQMRHKICTVCSVLFHPLDWVGIIEELQLADSFQGHRLTHAT